MPEYFKPTNIFTVNDSFNWQETNRLVILKIGLGVDLGTTKKQIQRVVRRLGDGTAVSTWSFEPREGLELCNAKAVPSSLSYFKTLSIGLVRGIGLSTSRSAGQRCMTDSMSSVTVKI